MAANTIIVIKKSQETSAPTALANGELAYSFSSNKLFIGQTTTSDSPVTVEYLGGKLLVDKVANLESIVIGDGSGSGISTSEINVSGQLSLGSLKFSNSNFLSNSLLYVKENGIVDFARSTQGKVMQMAANGAPVFADLDGGTY